MKADLFVHEAQKTSAVFGRNHGLSVEFAGEQACTNGQTIYLPAIDLTGEVSDDTAAIMRGYIDHEAGHVRHTDFDALKRWTSGGAGQLARALQNAIEDIWLERQVRLDYPGAARNLRATATAVNEEYLANIDEDDPRNADPRFVAPVAITWAGRRDYGGPTCETCLERVPEGLREAVERWTACIADCRGTADTIALAERIADEIGGMPSPEADSAEPEEAMEAGDDEGASSDEAESDSESDEDASDGGEHSPDDDQPSQDASDAESDASDTDDGQQAGVDDADGASDEEAEGNAKTGVATGHGAVEDKTSDAEDEAPYEPSDVSDLVRERLEGDGLVGEGVEGYRPYTTEYDKVHHRDDPDGKYRGSMGEAFGVKDFTYGARVMRARYDRSRYDQKLAAIGPTVGGMRRKLERALLSKQRRDWDHGREVGRLDSRRFGAAVAGRRNVFKIREERTELDTAVSILVDLSGSMNGPKASLASESVIAMSEALNRSGIPFEVLGFNNQSYEIGVDDKWFDAKQIAQRHDGAHRFDPLDIYEFKRFDERLNVAKGVLWQLPMLVGGDNGDAEAVLTAFQRLRERPESRRVLMVLSDGEPVTVGDQYAQECYLRDVVNRIEQGHEAECVGIGIMSTAVSRFYGRHVVVRDLDDLAGQAMNQLAKLLLGERFVVDNRKLGGL
jgi:cobalamin biosynthesis protein CobT